MKDFALQHALESVRSVSPLVHSITNYVTVNDCANALLAIGASPIMSDEPEDVFAITSICSALTLNIGTLNSQSIKAMEIAGARSADLGHPIVLDPVGAGASKLRTETAGRLLDTLPVAVIRGNMSEAKALASGASSTRGVDVCPDDLVTDANLAESVKFAQTLAKQAHAVVAITGPIDIIANAKFAYAVRNGTPLQERITGAGCMLSCMCAAYAAAYPDDVFTAIVAAVASMGLAGQIAEKRMAGLDGNSSFRTYMIDALYRMNGEMLEAGAQIEMVG